ncbi:MAG: methyltransferase [Geobacter sp.]|nr:methyltransferase [Geobacter sp.]
MQENQKSAAEIMRDMAGGFTLTQIVYTAVKLGIADQLKNGALTTPLLATAIQADQLSLHRFMRMMVVVGLLIQEEDGRFGLSPLGELLRRDHPESICNRILYIGEVNYPAAQGMSHAVKTGEPGFDHVFGMPFFDYFAQHPGIGALFNELMSQAVVDRAAGITATYDFTNAKTIVDVGGGKGTLITAILKAYPDSCGIIFDMPSVLTEAGVYLTENGVADRCETAAGDFFATMVPAGGDIYILSNILHDWEDTRAEQILRNCSSVMSPENRLLVVEQLLPEQALDAPVTVAADLSMMLLLRGRERTEAEYRELLSKAGLEISSITMFEPSRIYSNRKTSWAIIEGRPLKRQEG